MPDESSRYRRSTVITLPIAERANNISICILGMQILSISILAVQILKYSGFRMSLLDTVGSTIIKLPIAERANSFSTCILGVYSVFAFLPCKYLSMGKFG